VPFLRGKVPIFKNYAFKGTYSGFLSETLILQGFQEGLFLQILHTFPSVIPAFPYVIPAQAGIYLLCYCQNTA